MKKTLVALAVAALAAPLAAQADTTLYGRVDGRVVMAEDADADQTNGAVRIGVNTNHDLGNGLTSFAKVETNIKLDGSGEATNSTAGSLNIRKAYAGIKGGFGAFIIGRQDNPYAGVYKADMFEQWSGASEQGTFRLGKTVAYATPDMGGVNAAVGVVLDGEGTDEAEDINAIAAAVNFNMGPVAATLGYVGSDYSVGDTTAEQTLVGIGVSYSTGPIVVAFHAEQESENEETMAFDVAGQYNITDATALGVSFASATDDAGAEAESSRLLVGAYHTFGTKTTGFVALQNRTDKASKDAEEVDGTDFAAGFKVRW